MQQLDIGFELFYSHHLTAYKGAALYTANPSRPAVPLIDDNGRVVGDLPVAAKLLSLIA